MSNGLCVALHGYENISCVTGPYGVTVSPNKVAPNIVTQKVATKIQMGRECKHLHIHAKLEMQYKYVWRQRSKINT